VFSLLLAFSHMQDVIPVLAPISLAMFLAVGLPSLRVPARFQPEILIAALILVYLGFNIALNHSLTGISVVSFFGDQGRLVYMIGFFVAMWLPRPEVPLERRIYPAAVYVGAFTGVVSLYSLFVSRITLGQTVLSGNGLLQGFMGGHNPTAGSLGLVVIAFAVAFRSGSASGAPIKASWVSWLAIGIVFFTIMMTKSRGYAVALVGTLFLVYWSVFWHSLRRLRLTRATLVGGGLAVVGAVAAAAALSSRLGGEFSGNLASDPNLRIRLALWARAFLLGSKSPLFGLGLGTFEQTNLDIRVIIPGLVAVKRSGEYLSKTVAMSTEGGLHVHNIYLEMFCEIGLFGMGLMTWFFWRILRRRRRGGEVFKREFAPMVAAAQFNGELVKYLLVYLLVAGAVAGYTILSPGTAWLLYFAGARLVRQSDALRRAATSAGPADTLRQA